MTYRPRQGLFWLIFGLPVFGALRIGAEAFDDEPNYLAASIWAVGMAVVFATLATFTKILDK